MYSYQYQVSHPLLAYFSSISLHINQDTSSSTRIHLINISPTFFFVMTCALNIVYVMLDFFNFDFSQLTCTENHTHGMSILISLYNYKHTVQYVLCMKIYIPFTQLIKAWRLASLFEHAFCLNSLQLCTKYKIKVKCCLKYGMLSP